MFVERSANAAIVGSPDFAVAAFLSVGSGSGGAANVAVDDVDNDKETTG